MALLRDSDKKAVRERLEEMQAPVKLLYFTQEIECQFCRETGELLREVAELSDKITVETYNFVTDKEVADTYGVDKIPATVLVGEDEKDYGIRFYGIPSGYEFVTLLEDLLMVSSGDSGLDQATRDALKDLEGEKHMQVFVTPTCPYCPGAVRLAHQMAFESDKVRGDMVEATEFPQLSMKYNVRGVPRTVINEDHAFEGMMPEEMVLSEVLKVW